MHPASQISKASNSAPYRLLAIRFSDNRVAVGYSLNLKQRLGFYIAEARRMRVDGLCWYAPAPFCNKAAALSAVRAIRAQLLAQADPQCRQRFLVDYSQYPKMIDNIDAVRAQFALPAHITPADLSWHGDCGFWYREGVAA